MSTSPDEPSHDRELRPFWTHPLTLLWLGCWAALFVLTHRPMPEGIPVPPGGDKVMHFVAYFVLVMLGGRAAIGRGRTVTTEWVVRWTLIYALYGAADEWLQGYVHRTPAVTDWIANLCGVVMAMGLLVMYPKPTVGDETEVEDDG